MIGDLPRYTERNLGPEDTACSGGSVLTFTLSLTAITAVLVRLPASYLREGYVSPMTSQHSIVQWVGA